MEQGRVGRRGFLAGLVALVGLKLHVAPEKLTQTVWYTADLARGARIIRYPMMVRIERIDYKEKIVFFEPAE